MINSLAGLKLAAVATRSEQKGSFRSFTSSARRSFGERNNFLRRKTMNESKATVMQVFLLAAIVLATVAVKGALAAEPGSTNVPGSGGFQSNHVNAGFGGSTFDRAPAMPPPVFNQSNPYTMPQSPERPVSPASPGSIFGDH
jgi:hypothetical protein